VAQKRPVAAAPQDGHVPEPGGVGWESEVTSLKLQGSAAECRIYSALLPGVETDL